MARPRSPVARQIRRRLIVVGALLAAFAALFVAMCNQEPGREEVRLFVATALAEVLSEIEADFEATYPGVDLVLSLGASSALARQIEHGAPADVFFSASPVWTEYLGASDLLRAPAQVVIGNRLVVVGPDEAAPLGGLEDLLRLGRFAVADPERLPVGQYAREGFERAGLWDEAESLLVPVADARAAGAAVQAGDVAAAIVYASDVRGLSGLRVVLEWPEVFHPPIRFTIAVPRTTRTPNRAFEFVEFVRQPERDAVWRRYGFVPLAETVMP